MRGRRWRRQNRRRQRDLAQRSPRIAGRAGVAATVGSGSWLRRCIARAGAIGGGRRWSHSFACPVCGYSNPASIADIGSRSRRNMNASCSPSLARTEARAIGRTEREALFDAAGRRFEEVGRPYRFIRSTPSKRLAILIHSYAHPFEEVRCPYRFIHCILSKGSALSSKRSGVLIDSYTRSFRRDRRSLRRGLVYLSIHTLHSFEGVGCPCAEAQCRIDSQTPAVRWGRSCPRGDSRVIDDASHLGSSAEIGSKRR